MQEINQENIIIVIGDLGAGTNLVKNILLLNEEVDWPNVPTDNRLNFLKETAYPLHLKDNLTTWTSFEYKFRNFKGCYGVDVSDNYADLNTQLVAEKSQNNKIIFVCHWPEYAVRLKNIYPSIKLVSLYPETNFELLWQIKTYIDKVSIEKLQNFSFGENIESQKAQYINTFGEDEYYKFNVLNMIEILNKRKDLYKNIDGYAIQINSLLAEDAWIDDIGKFLNIKINKSNSLDLLNRWRSLHRPIEEIYNFKWFEKYYARTN